MKYALLLATTCAGRADVVGSNADHFAGRRAARERCHNGNRRGRQVRARTLQPDDFTVLEDGVPQKITHFTQDRNVPVSVGILLDTSGSMADKMRAASGCGGTLPRQHPRRTTISF